MSTIIKLYLVLATTSAFAVPDVAKEWNKAKPLAAAKVTAALTESKSLGTLVEHLRPMLDGETSKFLLQKIKGQEKQPLKIEKTGDLEFRMQAGQLIVPFAIKDSPEPGIVDIEINHHALTLDLSQDPEKVLAQINAALPQEARNWSLFPEADAQILDALSYTTGTKLPGSSFAAGPYGASQSYSQSYFCHKWDDATTFYGFLSAEQVTQAARMGNSLRARWSPFCQVNKSRLQHLLRWRAEQIGYKPPADLAAYFGTLKAPDAAAKAPESTQ